MAIKPILFNTEMVREILDGRKTVTRRVVKGSEKILNSPYHQAHPEVEDINIIDKLCVPPYQPGDILYVRETWMVLTAHRYEADAHIIFKAGGKNKIIQFPNGSTDSICRYQFDEFLNKWDTAGRCWNPSIHMPKEAARIWLRVTNVHVERLQEMSASEAWKEGIQLPPVYDTKERAYILTFADLWDSTIKKSDIGNYGWYANPFVWVIEFERCEKPD